MSTLEVPALDLSQVKNVLEVAHAILKRTQDMALARKMTNVSTYLTLSRVFPNRNYEPKVRESLADLNLAIQCYCGNEAETPPSKKTNWAPTN